MKNIVFKGIGVLLAVVLSSTAVFTPIGYAVPAEKTEQSGQNQTGTYQSEITYHEYLSQHAEMPTGKDTIILLADKYHSSVRGCFGNREFERQKW